MVEEPWMQDARREARWDARLAGHPQCVRCRQPVEERYLPREEGAVCERCVKWLLVEVE